MNDPAEIEVNPEEITVNAITQELYHVAKDEKFTLFLQLLKKENPENCLIFTNTKARCIEVSKRLSLNGYPTKYLMGDLPQAKRLQTIDRMKEGKIRFLVATDVAARGLQIDDLELVVNYDIPDDFENYVHRIGRTARAGKSGKSITLADEEYVFNLEAVENFIQMKIPVIWPEEGDLEQVEDKSASYSFRDLVRNDEYGGRPSRGPRSGAKPSRGGSRPPKRGQPQSSNRPKRTRDERDNKSRGPRPERQGRTQEPQRRRHTGSKSYAEIQNLSLEERLSYYKQQYKSEGGQIPEGTPAAKRSQPTGKKDIPVKKEPTPKQPVTQKQETKPKKKRNFFSRLFRRDK
jgi:ATP-dependent RNA helicase RhlB